MSISSAAKRQGIFYPTAKAINKVFKTEGRVHKKAFRASRGRKGSLLDRGAPQEQGQSQIPQYRFISGPITLKPTSRAPLSHEEEQNKSSGDDPMQAQHDGSSSRNKRVKLKRGVERHEIRLNSAAIDEK